MAATKEAPTSAEVRQWGIARGMKVKSTGVIPRAVRAEWDKRHPTRKFTGAA